MRKTDLYPIIFQRKSIRKYDLTPLSENTLAEISEYMDNLEAMYNDIKIELKIIGQDDVKRRMMKKAPHYIIVFSETKEGYLTNVGFMLQQMDLFFSANDIGSCWQALPQPNKEILESSELDFIILMPFGKPAEPLHRANVSEFKRKSLKKITDIEGADELLESARLAPSGGSEPWYFTGNENLIHVYSIKPNFIKGLLVKKYIQIDVGIAIYHLKLAVEHFDKKVKIVFDKPSEKNSKGYEYVTSLSLNNDYITS